jgi:glycosyltransferase involved in cell wall biosynthesis
MPFLDEERFMEEAISSVLAQTRDGWELLLVDDGSSDGSTGMARRYATLYPGRIRYLEHDGHRNLGGSTARNLGIAHARGRYLAFLDADDVWLPHCLEEQTALMEAHPEAAMVYGNALHWWSWDGGDPRRDFVPRLGVRPGTSLPPPELLIRMLARRVPIPCPCSVMTRRDATEEVGGFTDDFRVLFTDQGFFAKLALRWPIVASGDVWAKYRKHDNSCCARAERRGEVADRRLGYLHWLERHLADHRALGSRELRDVLAAEIEEAEHPLRSDVRRRVWRARHSLGRASRRALFRLLRAAPGGSARKASPPQRIDFGELRSLAPVGRLLGTDRGRPIHQQHAEAFLSGHAGDIRGSVLEVGAARYAVRFGGRRIAKLDELRPAGGNPWADPGEGRYDCVLVEGVLEAAYDLEAAAGALARALRPGGVLLGILPGIRPLPADPKAPVEYWRFTAVSADRLFRGALPGAAVSVETFGNVVAAVGAVQGLAAEDLRPHELTDHDPNYPVTVAVRVQAGERP